MVDIKLKLELEVEKNNILETQVPVLLLGSCFAEYQHQAFTDLCFETESNPFGIIYDPQSLAYLVERVANDTLYSEDDFILHNNKYFSLEHHGSKEYDSLQEAISSSNKILQETRDFIAKTGLCVITLGTSIIFEHHSNKVVANCHRVPSKEFTKRQLNTSEVTALITTLNNALHQLNPEIKTIFTVSPIRHYRSGLTQSSLSKAILRASIHEAGLDASYFPAYEIFIDELRDHRFSKEDLVHPTEIAQDYIFSKFLDFSCTPKFLKQIEEIRSYRKLQEHRPLRDEAAHKASLQKHRDLLLSKYPNLTI